MSRSLWPDLTWRRAEHMQVIKAMWAKRVSKKVRVLKSISLKQKFLCAPFYFVASKQRAAVAESRSCDRGLAADIFSASRPAASTDESHMQNVCKLHICSFFSCNKPLLWIIVTEWELELGFHRSNTVHQFFANPSLTLESAIHLQAAAVSPCLRCSPVMAMAMYPGKYWLFPPGQRQRSCWYWHSQPTLVRSFKTFI